MAGDDADTYRREEPSWLSATRLVVFGPTEHAVNYLDLGLPEQHWYEDWDVHPGYGAGLTDGEVSRQGDQVALLRGSVIGKRYVDIQRLGGAVPAAPSVHCESGSDAQVNSPTFSPDGTLLAWGDSEGILVVTGLTARIDCTKTGSYRIAPGASEPDLGPAPPPAPPAPPAPAPPAPPAPQPAPPAPQSIAIAGKPRVKGGKVKLRVTLARPARYEATLRLRGKPIAGKRGSGATVTLKVPARHARAVRKLGRNSRALTAVVSAGGVTRAVVVAPR